LALVLVGIAGFVAIISSAGMAINEATF
jgi:hypothetical protein